MELKAPHPFESSLLLVWRERLLFEGNFFASLLWTAAPFSGGILSERCNNDYFELFL